MSYLFLAIAIVAEVIATSALKASQGFSVLVPSIITILGYTVALFFLSLTLKTIPVGIAYARLYSATSHIQKERKCDHCTCGHEKAISEAVTCN